MKRHRQQAATGPAISRPPAAHCANAGGKRPQGWDYLQPALFLLFVFFYVWLSGVSLLRDYHSAPAQAPALWSALLRQPGGVVDDLCSLIARYDAHACIGALVALTEAVILSAGILLLGRKAVAPHACLVCMVPLGLWLILQNFYDAPIHSISLKLIAALWGAWLALAVGPLVSIPLLGVVVFWAGGINSGLVLLLIVAAFMLLFRRWALLTVSVLLLAAALFSSSFLAPRGLFSECRWSDARFPVFISCGLYLFVPSAVFLLALLRLRHDASPGGLASGPLGHRLPIAAELGVLAAFSLAMGAALWLTFDARERTIIRADICARQGNWAGVLVAVQNMRNPPAATRLDVHRALFHSGGLGETLFSVSQLKDNSLIPDLRSGTGAYLPLSELWLELGLVNAAQHYASEALEMRGPRPWILRQLARVYLLRGQPLAARLFLTCLKAFPFHRDWAEGRLVEIDSGRTVSDTDLSRFPRLSLSSDLISRDWPAADCLHVLLRANPTNRMASEFLMAHYLLSFQLERFVAELDHLDAFNDKHLPRYYEEALLLYLEDPRGPDVDLNRHSIRPEAYQRFARFKAVVRQKGLKSPSLEPALVAEFGDSLWFYYLFGHTSPTDFAHSS